MTQNDLANAYHRRILGERAGNLEQSIICYEQALQVFTREDFSQYWATTQNNLAAAYSERIYGDRTDNLEQAIICYKQALQVYTRDVFLEQWTVTQNQLLNVYSDRIRENHISGKLSLDPGKVIGEIVELIARTQGDSVQEVQVYDFFRANLEQLDESLLLTLPVMFLGMILNTDSSMIKPTLTVYEKFGTLINQFPLGNQMLNLELGIAAYEQVLQFYIREAFPEDWARTQSNLATAYVARIRGNRADNLEQAIEIAEQVRQVHTRDAFPEDWAKIQDCLASAYLSRIQGERADNLEKSIKYYKQSLLVRTHDTFPEDWAGTQHNLAMAYEARIRGDRADNLEQAVEYHEQVLQVYTREAFPEKWTTAQNGLATAYLFRIQGLRAENIEQAIKCYKQTLQVRTRETFPKEWAMTQHNLALAYECRILGERADNLERSIEYYEQALQVRTHDTLPEDWAMTQHNLAVPYLHHTRGDSADNLEQSINASKQALQVYTLDTFPESWAGTQHNLALAYSKRIQGDRAENLEQAIQAYEQALTVMTTALPDECHKTARQLAELYIDQNCWVEAARTYKIALQAAEICYQRSDFLDTKSYELSTTNALNVHAAYTYAKVGDLTQAITTLEQGRARGLSESLSRDRTNLDALKDQHPSLYTQYQAITIQLHHLEIQQRNSSSSLTRSEIRSTSQILDQKLQTKIAQIRQVPGYEDFLTPTKWEDISKALTSNNPVIYIITTPSGGMALIATDNTIDLLPLNDLTFEGMSKLLFFSGDIEGGWVGDYLQSAISRETWHNTIESTTRQLWDLLMGPIVHHLKTKGFDRATLIPTGYLSLLPLHAAWTPDTDLKRYPTGKRYAIDDIHFTYTPNARSLTEARKIADRPFTDSILAIDDPSHGLPDIQTLHNSQREIDCAIDSFSDRTVLRHDNATIDAVKSGLAKAAIVHFSCHGTANFTEPLNSGLLMSDGLLTLKDLLALNLAQDSGIRLAILSACETGLPGLENIDEVVSLPIGLLQAGVAGVISSLWSISDLSTMLLLTKFYELWRDQKLPPDQALRQAQIWLRDTTTEQMIEALEAVLPEFNTRQLSETTTRFLHDELSYKPNGRLFAHPFHWAAFSYNGV